MAVEDLAQNLKLLCSYGKSVSDICRKLKINRQQFNSYLSGASNPSLRTVRKICDFFGVDDHELLLDGDSFKELIRLRPPKVGENQDIGHAFFDSLCRPSEMMLNDLERYVGYYYIYHQPNRNIPEIDRSIIRLFVKGDFLMSKQIERYSGDKYNLPSVIKYDGIVFYTGNKLVITERETFTGAALWNTILYTSDYSTASIMPGLSLGVAPNSANDIVCYRTVWEFLGPNIDLRAALNAAGSFDLNAPEITDYIRQTVSNDLMESDFAFSPKI